MAPAPGLYDALGGQTGLRTLMNDFVNRLKAELMARKVLPFAAENRIHVVPPCIVTPDQVADALQAYDGAFSAVAQK